MAKLSSHFKLQELSQGDSLNLNGYAFTLANIDDIDSYLYRLFAHHHDGTSPTNNDPASALGTSLSTTGGSIGPGLTLRYVYSLVDSFGTETQASPVAVVTTPSPVSPPNAPSLSSASTGGTLLAGTYFYALSAYVGTNTFDTTLGVSATILVPAGLVNKITLTLPSLPSGATGFNVYRRAPGEASLFYLSSVDVSGATPPTTYVDNGTTAENCNRYPSTKNTTNASNSVTVTLPGATPTVPAGYTWRLYRSINTTSFNNCLLASVVSETFTGSGIITPTYTDIGAAVVAGTPRTSGVVIPAFSKIDLATETMSSVSPSRTIGPSTVYFSYSGFLDVGPGDFVWYCPFDQAQIVDIQSNLGWDQEDNVLSVPHTTTVITDIQKYTGGATPTWTSVYSSSGNRSSIAIGQNKSSVFATSSADHRKLVRGDVLRINIIAVDDFAFNLMVNVKIYSIDGTGLPANTAFVFDA